MSNVVSAGVGLDEVLVDVVDLDLRRKEELNQRLLKLRARQEEEMMREMVRSKFISMVLDNVSLHRPDWAEDMLLAKLKTILHKVEQLGKGVQLQEERKVQEVYEYYVGYFKVNILEQLMLTDKGENLSSDYKNAQNKISRLNLGDIIRSHHAKVELALNSVLALNDRKII